VIPPERGKQNEMFALRRPSPDPVISFFIILFSLAAFKIPGAIHIGYSRCAAAAESLWNNKGVCSSFALNLSLC
jgi:hypothetical protein